MIRSAQFIERLNIKRICEMDDRLSIRYSRALKVKKGFGTIFGTFSNAIPPLFKWLAGYISKHILRTEVKRISKRESEIVNTFNAVTLTSPKESEELRSIIPNANIVSIPPAFHNKRFVKQFKNNNQLLFIGNLLYSQNLASFEYIVETILPVLDTSDFEYTFSVAGCYDNQAQKIANRNENVKLLGYAKSLRRLMQESSLLVAPIVFGTGIKVKIIDALSCGLPVVTNSYGIEGIPGHNNVDYIVEDDPVKIAGSIIRICSDSNLKTTIGANGYALFEAHYNFNKIQTKYIKMVDSL